MSLKILLLECILTTIFVGGDIVVRDVPVGAVDETEKEKTKMVVGMSKGQERERCFSQNSTQENETGTFYSQPTVARKIQ